MLRNSWTDPYLFSNHPVDKYCKLPIADTHTLFVDMWSILPTPKPKLAILCTTIGTVTACAPCSAVTRHTKHKWILPCVQQTKQQILNLLNLSPSKIHYKLKWRWEVHMMESMNMNPFSRWIIVHCCIVIVGVHR